MDADRWQRLSPLIDALLELDAEARAERLAALRAEDPAQADEIQALLALEADGDDFLARPLIAPPREISPGTEIGPYALERKIGEGGMGQVWLARRTDGPYRKPVALKLLRPGIADPSLRLRFTRERQILARLEHPHIAHLLDAGISADQQPYLALEYVEGEPITDWCQARSPDVETRVRLFLQVCAAVSHAHANLIVHRDLKPSNILVTPTDEVRLLDFGIAKLLDTPDSPENTRTGLRTFTLHYAAPEQIRGEPVTTMTDVYSLGVVLYELLTGDKPYQLKRPSDAQWEEAILRTDPLRPSQQIQRAIDGPHAAAMRRRMHAVAGDLDNIVLKALSKRPEHRYPSVEALALDLQRWLEGNPVHARPQSLAYRTRKYIRRHRWALSTALAVSLVLATSLGVVAWQARQALAESTRAQAMQNFVVGLFENAGNTPPGAPLDVRRLLEDGVQRGQHELARQPLARAELFGVIARLRTGIGDYDQAMELLQRQKLIVDLIPDAPVGMRLQLANDLGRIQHMMDAPQDCIASMQPLRQLAGRYEKRLPVQASDFYAQLGRCHRASGRQDSARLLYHRSMALRRDPLGNDAGIVENLADLAVLRADAGDSMRALTEMRAALSRLRSTVGDRHPLAIELLRKLCSLQREQDDTRGAGRDCSQALALALELRGPQHHATIDARRQLAAIHVDQGRYAEADREFRETLAWLTPRLGPHHADVALGHNSLGIVAWERGDLDEALERLQLAVSIWREADNTVLLGSGLFNQAMILHEAGRDREARPLLLESLQLRRDSYGGQHGRVGTTLRLLGEVDAALGDRDAALEALQQAERLTRSGFGPAHSYTLRAEISLARHLARHGDRDAIARLDRIGARVDDDIELRKAAWLARAYAAEFRCLGPQRAEALSTLSTLATAMRLAQPEGGAVPREILAIAQRCRAPAGAPAGSAATAPTAAAGAAAARSAPRRA